MPGSEYERCNHWKTIGITSYFTRRRYTVDFSSILWNSLEIEKFNEKIRISWKSWNFMKFNDFLDSATLHETFVFLAQNQGLSGLDFPKLENP